MYSLVERKASTDRRMAAAGLLISWANPAASVPSATRDSRWRAVASMLRTVWNTPVIRCLLKGDHAPTSRASSAAGTTKHRPRHNATPEAR